METKNNASARKLAWLRDDNRTGAKDVRLTPIKKGSPVRHLNNAEIKAAFPDAVISPKRIGDAMKRKRERDYWRRKYEATAAKRLEIDRQDTVDGINKACK